MTLFIKIFRTLFFYFFITLIYRIMGKREIGQLGIIDLIVSILIAELVAISIENTNDSIMLTIIPIIILVIIEIILAFISLKSRRIRQFIQGKPSIIILNGKINYKELINQRLNIDDLLLNLRINSVNSIDEVEYAFLESNGKISIFKYNNKKKSNYPMPVIINGKIDEENLNKINHTKRYIYNILEGNKVSLENIFYGFYNNEKLFIIEKNSNNAYLNNKYLK